MEEKEETRKIQFTGKSSYIVSLPKQWIIDLGLKQGYSSWKSHTIFRNDFLYEKRCCSQS